LIVSPHLRTFAADASADEAIPVRAMAQAISDNRIRFASKALKMFMPQVHAT
jgi:hypothetical protein